MYRQMQSRNNLQRENNMKQYTDISKTPLKFHFFIYYVRMPLTFILAFFTLVSNFGVFTYSGEFLVIFVIDWSFQILQLVFAAGSFDGFRHWKKHGWYFQISLCILSVVQYLYLCILSAIYVPEENIQQTASLTSAFIINLLIILYYCKRKPLFFNESNIDKISQNKDVKYCTVCGQKMKLGEKYCCLCGNKMK